MIAWDGKQLGHLADTLRPNSLLVRTAARISHYRVPKKSRGEKKYLEEGVLWLQCRCSCGRIFLTRIWGPTTSWANSTIHTALYVEKCVLMGLLQQTLASNAAHAVHSRPASIEHSENHTTELTPGLLIFQCTHTV